MTKPSGQDGRTGAGGRSAQRVANVPAPIPSHTIPNHHHPNLHHHPHPTHPTTTPSPSPSSHSPQTPLHRGCSGWASPVEAYV